MPDRETNTKKESGSPRIVLDNVSAQWEPKKSKSKEENEDNAKGQDTKVEGNPDSVKLVLQNVNIDISGEKLLAIVGPVGSGKVSVLSALCYVLKIENYVHINTWGS